MIALWIILGLIGVLLLLVLFAVVKTLLFHKRKVSTWQPKKDPEREQEYAEKLSKMVQFETVSKIGEVQREKFLEFHKVLEGLFPLVHEKLQKTEINGSLLFFWEGKKHDKPIVLMGHQDVVPAEGEWIHPPYSGDIADGKVWGRGSGDTKCSVMSFFQAVEELLKEGYVPEQDIYLSSSNTEEISGPGCPGLVAELKKRGVKPFLVVDEGGAIVTEPIGGFPGYYAMVGVLEKGMGNLKVIARSNGGHSSYPPKNSPIARLALFVSDIEKHSPMKAAFEPEVQAMFEGLADYGGFAYRLLFGNFWLFKPLLTKLLPVVSPMAGALLKTTTAFTMQEGSKGSNVMPQEAYVVVNLRYIPHQNQDEAEKIIRDLAAKYDLTVERISSNYPSLPPVSIDSEAYHLVEGVINEVFPGLPVCPYVMTGGTDARFYQEICDACVRFSPVAMGPEQLKGMHGLNENIETVALPGAVDFYKEIIKRLSRQKDCL